MGSVTARTLSSADQEAATNTLLLAFAADPVARWSWPAADLYLSAFPELVVAFGGGAFAHRGAHGTDSFGSVALWLPPGVHPDEDALGATFGLLVLGSPDARRFHEGMGTAYLGQIGEVAGAALNRLRD